MKRRALTLVVALTFAACSMTPEMQTGIMAGRWTPKGGETERVPLSWESSDDEHGRVHATLGKGGEHFTGKYVRVQTGEDTIHLETVYNDWQAPTWATLDWGPEGNYGASVDYLGFVKGFSGSVVATLFGNEGHSMRCQFTANDPSRGLISGGVGTCQVSDGGQLDVQF
jgi:hypothetical protein